MTGTRTVKIREETHLLLKDLSESTGMNMQDVIANLVEKAREDRFFATAAAAYATLTANTSASKAEKGLRKGLSKSIPAALRDAIHARNDKSAAG